MRAYPDTHYAATLAGESAYPSFEGQADTETIVIGGGLAGLATVLALAAAGRPAILLEARRIGWGASGRNGGFASRGYPLTMPEIAARHGRDTARALWRLASQALDLVRHRAKAAGPSVLQGQGALRARVKGHPDTLRAHVEVMNETFNAGLEFIPAPELRRMLDTDFYADAFLNPSSLQIHPLNLVQAMAREASARGARLHEGTPAVTLRRTGAGWEVLVSRGKLVARHVVLAGGAHLGMLFPRLELATVPVASFVMTSAPAPEQLRAAIGTDYAVSDGRVATDYYRRLPDGRLLWGGRASAIEWSPARAKGLLRGDLVRIYPQLADLAIERTWSGLMPIARHRMPVLGPVGEGLWAAACFGGLGMVTTTLAGELIASAIAHGDDRYRHFAPFGLPFAGGPLGRAAFQVIYWRHKLEDRWLRRKASMRREAA